MRKILGWLLTGRRPLWTAAGIVVLIILSWVITPIASYASAQPQNATLVAALVALLGISITQIVNTVLARTGEADLSGADLSGATLRGANLSGATYVTQAQIDSATGDATTKLPDGRQRPTSWTD